jgi:hypothetical protein
MSKSTIDIRSLITKEIRITAQIKNHRGNYLKKDGNENEVDLCISKDGTFAIQDKHSRENLTFEGSSVSWRAPNGQLSQRFELHQSKETDLPYGLFCLGNKKYLGVDLLSFLKIETLVSKPALGAWESFQIKIVE